MDQSLRTVATQLLNVTSTEEASEGKDKPKMAKGELPPNIVLLRKPAKNSHSSANGNQQNFDSKTKSDMELVQEINSEISALESMGIGFGRPTNSKFGYFESSHPGQAMAMTEEELERELMSSTSTSTRLMTAHKNHPTTTGGISTWILLNSPTTTGRPLQDYNNNNDEKKVNVQVRLQTKVTTPVKIFETTLKTNMKTVSTEEKSTSMESTTPMEKITTLTKSTTPTQRKTTVAPRPTTTTERPVKTTQSTKAAQTVTWSSVSSSGSTRNDVKVTSPKPSVVTKKPMVSGRPTSKPKLTIPKPANVTSKPMATKLGRPNQSGKPKTTPPRKSTTKPVVESTKNPSTSKIEKVTFRPVQMITTPKSLIESVERPMFVTKIKTSLVADTNSKTTAAIQSVTTSTVNQDVKSNLSDVDLVEVSTKTKPQPMKTNNVLKVQLKKPAETQTKIEIEPIKVNAPVLKIEKIEDREKVTKKDVVKSSTPSVLDNSPIDLKFDFNPELTRIDVETATDVAPSSTTSRRPHKRKKNKVRRRKPTTSASLSTATSAVTQGSTTLPTTTIPTTTEDQEALDFLTELGIVDNSIQESKVVPESKISANNTKNKKKQVAKPIGTQIYNFLSREVMPSFGVMSLVGLGLGLASYFLYPFGGTIARRNYVVEPNYKYNLDEYGGNYGQNEEEVFSKVLQGMTNNDGKYGGIKDYENNFYRYQHFDGAYTAPHTTRKGDPRYPTSSSSVYRPPETTVYDTKYRNTEFKYPDVSTTPNYYERQKQEFVTKKSGHGDRQFVVGNVPKEYEFSDKGYNVLPSTTQPVQPVFEREIAQNHKFVKNTADISPTYEQPEAQALKANEGYEEIEITPAAVAVEHGPRSLKLESTRLRRKRESVIQMIPSRSELEKEEEEIEKEEPLSNEILDIIDSVIPEDMTGVGKFVKPHNESHDEKKHELDKKALQGDDSQKTVDKTKENTETVSQDTPEATAKASNDGKTSTEASPTSTSTTTTTSTSTTDSTIHSLTIDEILGMTTNSNGKDPEDSSVEWFDHSTTEKPHNEPMSLFGFVKKIAEVKLRLGIAILKHASEGFARYLGHVQKRVNGEE